MIISEMCVCVFVLILTNWHDILALPPVGRGEGAGRPRQDRRAGVTRVFTHLQREGGGLFSGFRGQFWSYVQASNPFLNNV